MFIDLQTHTTASDGKFSPTQLVQQAKKLNISYLSKTDHDTVDLMPEFLAAGKKFKIKTIPGIEISSRHKDKSLHILGLGIDYKHKAIRAYNKKCILARKQRGFKMAGKLKQAGWFIKKSVLNDKLLTRPHVAHSVLLHPANRQRLIKEFGELPNFSTFIRKYLVTGKHGFVPKSFSLKPLPAIKMIKQAGGLSIIAHPGSTSSEFNYTKQELLDIIKLGFDGLELYSSTHSPDQIKYFKQLIKKFKLLASAGSDYHGYDQICPLGICNNGKYVDYKKCSQLLKRLN